MIKNWAYRAINSQLQISDGIAQARSFIELSLLLRQRGLQILEAQEVQPDHVLAIRRLENMKKAVTAETWVCSQTNQPKNMGWWKRMLKYVGF
jgi:type II secretory pathway component PulF